MIKWSDGCVSIVLDNGYTVVLRQDVVMKYTDVDVYQNGVNVNKEVYALVFMAEAGEMPYGFAHVDGAKLTRILTDVAKLPKREK